MARLFTFAVLCQRAHPLKHSLAESKKQRKKSSLAETFVSRLTPQPRYHCTSLSCQWKCDCFVLNLQKLGFCHGRCFKVKTSSVCVFSLVQRRVLIENAVVALAVCQHVQTRDRGAVFPSVPIALITTSDTNRRHSYMQSSSNVITISFFHNINVLSP